MRALILTARLDADSQTYFNALRQQHFPPERNYLDAHLTLFHALPGEKLEQINVEITRLTSDHGQMEATTASLRSLGRGVAYAIEAPELVTLRTALTNAFRSFLIAQDRQRWRPHITVQNKVSPEAAQRLLQLLERDFQPRRIELHGLELWHYEGGPWTAAHSYPFQTE